MVFSVKCEGKCVKEAYHVICNPCSAEHKICAKCLQSTTNNVETGACLDGKDSPVDEQDGYSEGDEESRHEE